MKMYNNCNIRGGEPFLCCYVMYWTAMGRVWEGGGDFVVVENLGTKSRFW